MHGGKEEHGKSSRRSISQRRSQRRQEPIEDMENRMECDGDPEESTDRIKTTPEQEICNCEAKNSGSDSSL